MIYVVVVAWAVLSGLSKVASAIRGRADHERLMVASGALSGIFGIVLRPFLPGAGLLALVWVIGIYATAVVIAFITYSYRLRIRELRRSESGRAA